MRCHATPRRHATLPQAALCEKSCVVHGRLNVTGNWTKPVRPFFSANLGVGRYGVKAARYE